MPAGPGPALVELPTVPVAGPSAPLEGSDLPGAVVREAMAIDGALAVAVADSTTGSLLARTPDPDRLDLADAVRDYAAVVASMHETLARMGRTDHVEDVLVTYGGQYHVLRMLAADPTVFVLLVLDRRSATLALARMRLSRVERDLRR
ncbi:roadblock/LC7 domain-containing protein [Phycicoccus flavus]|uniref:Roadblock/LAMTOR2 domain-containing protein n=1 Tax=Phycicoccus flavus TaxID=2502783 RepID=A0A8T6R1G8_9MICO|nr:hypothetical protein [Phycicoccus flavus]NHA67716.1 hypothetical protein [Phycicoccus flavus]